MSRRDCQWCAAAFRNFLAAQDRARRWKALARRLRERLSRSRVYAQFCSDDAVANARRIVDARESHARELMESAARYGAQIERLQRERDDYRDLLQEEMRLHSVTLTGLNEEREAHAATRARLRAWDEHACALESRVRVLEGALEPLLNDYESYAHAWHTQAVTDERGTHSDPAGWKDCAEVSCGLAQSLATAARGALEAKEKPNG